jgi:hypothetical protein
VSGLLINKNIGEGRTMTTNSKVMQVNGQEGAVNTDAEKRGYANDTKAKGLFGRMKHLIGKAVTIDEDWIFKSKDWPYMWKHKDTNDEA